MQSPAQSCQIGLAIVISDHYFDLFNPNVLETMHPQIFKHFQYSGTWVLRRKFSFSCLLYLLKIKSTVIINPSSSLGLEISIKTQCRHQVLKKYHDIPQSQLMTEDIRQIFSRTTKGNTPCRFPNLTLKHSQKEKLSQKQRVSECRFPKISTLHKFALQPIPSTDWLSE